MSPLVVQIIGFNFCAKIVGKEKSVYVFFSKDINIEIPCISHLEYCPAPPEIRAIIYILSRDRFMMPKAVYFGTLTNDQLLISRTSIVRHRRRLR